MSLLSNLEPGLTGLEQLRALLAAGRQPPIHEAFDIALVAADEGAVVVEARPSDRHLNPAGTVGGGYIATILDTACACAVHSALPIHTGYTTLELQLLFHRSIAPGIGRMRVEGKLLSIGRRAAFSEAMLFDANHRLLASASSTVLVMPLLPADSSGVIGTAVHK